jgi:uncharacterized cupin superfamily protein
MTHPLQLPAVAPVMVPEQSKTSYPEPYAARVAGRSRRRLGDACGLSQFGVNLTTLRPGAQSALRHWHTHEDEFIYVLSGTLVLVTTQGEQTLNAGDCAGFPAGIQDGHHLINQSDRPAQFLEVGSRVEADFASYPDNDLQWLRSADGDIAAHKDGLPWTTDAG